MAGALPGDCCFAYLSYGRGVGIFFRLLRRNFGLALTFGGRGAWHF